MFLSYFDHFWRNCQGLYHDSDQAQNQTSNTKF